MRSIAVLALLLVTGCGGSPPVPTESSSASADPVESSAAATGSPEPSSTTFGAPTTETIDTADWVEYTSERYGFRIGHPPDWSVSPSQRTWTMADSTQFDNDAQERFLAPDEDVLVTAWATPYPGEATPVALQAWVERYCVESGNVRCATIGDRAVRLCHEQRDCHPGLLVPFESDVQAFFTGGQHDGGMIAVAVWRPGDWQVEGYGTARDLLDGFLSTMDVRPQP
ncbi:hypothetical protein [Agrococcus sp. DT81.2]|uniref:hypothetical protein n=1 Tax=Agrococcus sp. DT81.2 TaxID=3393414 RepID=UPI003CE54018